MATRYGTGGSDTLHYIGVDEPLTIFAYGGDDDVWGTRFDDVVLGGDGNDHVAASDGDDRVWGEGGDDVLSGSSGDDQLIGGAGHDDLDGGADDDWLWGEGGDDRLVGGAGNDHLYGGAGDDVIYGSFVPQEGVVSLPSPYGPFSYPADSDVIHGGDGNDRIFGQRGRDTLSGGRGYDTLSGGTGADRFVFDAADVVTRSAGYGPFRYTYETIETDTITDFGEGGDLIDLASLLDGKTSFAGATAADAVAQSYVYWVQHGQPGDAGFGTTVYVDRNGGALDALNAPDLVVADLRGVAAGQINDTHFIV